ncbi:MAG: ATP-binding protein, partial [Ruthenibacterium sp.]
MVAVASPALLLLFGGIIMCMLLDVRWCALSQARKMEAVLLFVAILLGNIVARAYCGNAVYAKFYFFFAQLPLCLLFHLVSRYKGIKLLFVLLTTIVLAAPSVVTALLLKSFCKPTVGVILAANLLSYAAVILLVRFFLQAPFHYMLEYGENRMFWMFSAIPLLYYLYAYGTTKYQFAAIGTSRQTPLYLIPDVIVFVTYGLLLYLFKAVREKNRLQSEQSMMTMRLEDAKRQMEEMTALQEQAAVYRHDMRHHFGLLCGYLAEGRTADAMAYLGSAQSEIDAVTPVRYCRNNAVNLILSSFAAKAARRGVAMTIAADYPPELSFPETELCALLSNGLENAVEAAAKVTLSKRTVRVCCNICKGNLLIFIENSYEGEIVMENGLPQNRSEGHGFGVKSMEMLTKRHNGYCAFTAQDGRFTLKIVLPLS